MSLMDRPPMSLFESIFNTANAEGDDEDAV